MNSGRVFEIRFLVPPILAIFFVFLLSPECFNKLLEKYNSSTQWIFGATVVLALGFIISSITQFFIINKKLKKIYEGEFSTAKLVIDEDFKSWEGIFPKKEGDVNDSNLYLLELMNWLIIVKKDNSKDRYIGNQIDKRWSMGVANFNSFIALVFSLIIIVVLPMRHLLFSDWGLVWFVIWIAVLFVFWKNGTNALESVLSMDRALLRLSHKNSE